MALVVGWVLLLLFSNGFTSYLPISVPFGPVLDIMYLLSSVLLIVVSPSLSSLTLDLFPLSSNSFVSNEVMLVSLSDSFTVN